MSYSSYTYNCTKTYFSPSRKTLQTTQARIVSGFGWGMTRRIENHGLNKFKANIQRVCDNIRLLSLMEYVVLIIE